MNRCVQCLLPDSLPDSDFDPNGVCSWCRIGYPNYRPLGRSRLEEKLQQVRSRSASAPADCLVGISGGKDSSFALMELKKTFGLRVEAFTYTHFGLNLFALENARRVCAELGITHHIVSLPGDAHLRSFRRFFKAWLDNPSTTAAGLTCVACKHLHLLGCKCARKRRIPYIFWANCPLEYAPFLAIKADTRKDFIKRGSILSGSMLLVKELFHSGSLLQAAILEAGVTIPGCLAISPDSRFLSFRYPRIEQVFFYSYVDWQPETIVHRLEREVGWGKPALYPDDWHSDCAFDVFKEYMFQKMLGISYTDSFLSSQIRHRLITREAAWSKLLKSKAFFAALLPEALQKTGLEKYVDRIDCSCFNIV